MDMPGRNVGQDYRFGMNGKTNDDELYEGSQDFEERIYDNRLGKFLSTDPLVDIAPDQSPFSFAENNPIWKIDFEGLKTKYFNHKGELLFESNDNLTNAVVILSEQEERVFSYYMNQLKKGNRNLHDNKLNLGLRDQFGIKYYISTLVHFHDQFKDFKYMYDDGTVSNYGHETGTGLFLDDCKEVVLGEKAVIGNPGLTPWNTLYTDGDLDGCIGLIHTHDNGGAEMDAKIAQKLNEEEGSVFYDEPSLGDFESNSKYVKKKDTGFDVAISENNITFYKNSSTKNYEVTHYKEIIIDTKSFKIIPKQINKPYTPKGGAQKKKEGEKVTSYQNARFLD